MIKKILNLYTFFQIKNINGLPLKVKIFRFLIILKMLIEFNVFKNKSNGYKKFEKNILTFKSALEIGGPSDHIFGNKSIIPVYDTSIKIDFCNFSDQTIWNVEKKSNIQLQYISDILDIKKNISKKYDLVLASHVIEHSANALLALENINAILNDNAIAIIVLPHKDATFDWRRENTNINHFFDDYNNKIDESDTTHFADILKNHDLKLDPGAGNFENLKKRLSMNINNRGAHHHVFTTKNATELIKISTLKLIYLDILTPNHIILFCSKKDAKYEPFNIDLKLNLFKNSPFPSDIKDYYHL